MEATAAPPSRVRALHAALLDRVRRGGRFLQRHLLQHVANRWRRSLLFKTVTSTLLLVALACGGVGAFLSHQIAGALYEERFDQYLAESSTDLMKVKEVFRTTTATDREETDRLVSDTRSLLEGEGIDEPRSYLLQPLHRDPYVSPQGLNFTASQIPVALADAVDASDAVGDADRVYWSALELPSGGPGLAFGTKVTLPPDRSEYALYLIYDLSSMQDTLDGIHGILWIAGGLLLVIIGAIAWIVTKAGVGAVSDAAAVSEKHAAGELQERMDVRGVD